MVELDAREWLLTNGLGSISSGTVGDARTRTYHGWLIAALDPPAGRTLLLSHLEATLEVGGQVWELGTNFWGDGAIAPLGYQLLRSFETDPCPRWSWGAQNWELRRHLLFPYGLENASSTHWENRLLMEYCYQGTDPAILRLRPLIGDRNFHHQQFADGMEFSQSVRQQQLYLQAVRYGEPQTPWQLRWSAGDYQADGFWYWNYYLPQENQRGLGDREDLYSPGCLQVILQPGETVTLEAKVGWDDPPAASLGNGDFQQAVLAEERRLQAVYGEERWTAGDDLWRHLLRAGDRFIVHRASISGPTVIAGYPWFNDWGRDTLISLPGLTLTTKRFEIARGLLETFGRYCQNGLIPNTFPDRGDRPAYNSIDAALWWIEVLGLYLQATEDWQFLEQHYPIVRKIYKAFRGGTLYNICTDASDGLLMWDAPGVAITWMDAVIDGQPITPRRGKPVEINALWYSALCWATQWAQQLGHNDQAEIYRKQANVVKGSLSKFWNSQQGYFYDAIAPDDQPDGKIRPNAVLALSLQHCGFPEERARRVLQVARDRLLTPYGLRSLDPADPEYVGGYAGDRTRRDRAYHQGTVWSWLIGPFISSWQRFYGEPVPFNWQPLIEHFQQQACLQSISEIFDGDAPHAPRGAIAQAWSVAELIRYYR